MNNVIKKSFVIGSCVVGPIIPCPIKANIIEACDSDNIIVLTSGETQFNKSITPLNLNVELGLLNKPFNNINAISGNTNYFESTIKVITPKLELGLDNNNVFRFITANNSIISGDVILGGTY